MPERKFYVCYGVVDDPETVKRSDDGEMWNVRRAAMAVAKTAATAYRDAGQEPAAECYDAIFVHLLEAPVGQIMFGLTVEIDIAEVRRFIALVPAGAELADNQAVDRFKEGDTVAKIQSRTHPTSHLPTIESVRASERIVWGGTTPSRESRKKAQRASEDADRARRIAAEMAAATRKAVEE